MNENLRLSKSIKGSKHSKSKGKSEQKGKSSGKKGKSKNKQRQQNDMAWKKRPPKDGENLVKVVNGRTYNWCPEHMAWTVHKPSECKLAQQRNSSGETKPRSSTLNQAMTAILEELEEDEE